MDNNFVSIHRPVWGRCLSVFLILEFLNAYKCTNSRKKNLFALGAAIYDVIILITKHG